MYTAIIFVLFYVYPCQGQYNQWCYLNYIKHSNIIATTNCIFINFCCYFSVDIIDLWQSIHTLPLIKIVGYMSKFRKIVDVKHFWKKWSPLLDFWQLWFLECVVVWRAGCWSVSAAHLTTSMFVFFSSILVNAFLTNMWVVLKISQIKLPCQFAPKSQIVWHSAADSVWSFAKLQIRMISRIS